jgi:Outer membrane receptor proteins, mostly Fe trans port
MAEFNTHQKTNYDIYNLKIKSQINSSLGVSLNTSREVKDSTNSYYLWSDIVTYDTPTKNDYDYRTADLSYNFKSGNIKVDSGLTTFNGERKGSSDTTTKDNIGVFGQGAYKLNNYTYSIGARKESVNYAYNPNSGTALSDGHNLKAYDIGFNKKINEKTTIFSNYNVAFQAPLIDRFFDWNGTFNGFMNPSKSKTVNIGLNYLTNKSKTKVTLFRSNVTDEMYYYSGGFKNTNIDKSHKQGIELQNKYQFNPKLLTNVNYAYTKAIIDEENEASGTYNGKDLPMVSKHNITLSANYNIDDKSKISLTHKYRSKAFSEEDFANDKLQKQKEFKSTDIGYFYKHNKDLDFTVDIENLFKNSYGTWLRDDIIYPSSFTRNIKAGLTYHF